MSYATRRGPFPGAAGRALVRALAAGERAPDGAPRDRPEDRALPAADSSKWRPGTVGSALVAGPFPVKDRATRLLERPAGRVSRLLPRAGSPAPGARRWRLASAGADGTIALGEAQGDGASLVFLVSYLGAPTARGAVVIVDAPGAARVWLGGRTVLLEEPDPAAGAPLHAEAEVELPAGTSVLVVAASAEGAGIGLRVVSPEGFAMEDVAFSVSPPEPRPELADEAEEVGREWLEKGDPRFRAEPTLEFTGELLATSRTPRPGMLPYDVCLIATRYRVSETSLGRAPADEVVVVHVGMAKKKRTPAAYFKKGERHRVACDAFANHFAEYKSEGLQDDVTDWGRGVKGGLGTMDDLAQKLDAADWLMALRWEWEGGTPPADPAAEEAREAGELAAKAAAGGNPWVEGPGAIKVAGEGGGAWYFLRSELRSYSAGPFWGEAAAKACVSEKDPDPLPAILHFKEMLDKAGIGLLVVPVPGKVAVHGDRLEGTPGADAISGAHHREFIGMLEEKGVRVVDLLPDFIEMRAGGVDSHCRQDSHWTPAAMELAAKRIAEVAKAEEWCRSAGRKEAAFTPRVVRTPGDLVGMLEERGAPKEELALREVKLGGSWVESDPASPVVLMGDSHTIVYHMPIEGGIAAAHAGLPDHLSAELGFAVDFVGVQGSGANGPRQRLARRRGDQKNLRGKRLAVWVFTARELTEAPNGWKLIPVIR